MVTSVANIVGTPTAADPNGVVSLTANYNSPLPAPTETRVIVGLDDRTSSEKDDLVTKSEYFFSTTFSYAFVARTIDPQGNVTEKTYNSSGQLIADTDGSGNSTRYLYDRSGTLDTEHGLPVMGNVKYIEDPDRNATHIDSDPVTGQPKRIRTQQYRSDTLVETKMEYNPQGDLVKVTDPQGKDRLVDRDLNGNSDGTDYTWIDPNGLLGQDVLTTTTIFDENDKAVGTESRLDSVLQSSTTTNYDTLGRPWQTIDANGLKTENLYDKRGLVIQTRSETLNTGTNPATSQVERIWNVSRTVFDEQGRAVISVSGMTQYASETVNIITPVADITGSRSQYNTKGQLASSEQLRGVDIQITGTTPNLTSVLGNIPTIVSTSSTTYDADNRVTQTTDAFGKISQSYYDRWGNVVESRTQTKNETGTSLWMVTRSVFDATGRLVASTDPYTVPSATPLGKPGGNSPAVFATFTLYDSRGRSIGSERRSNVVTGWSSDTDRILSAIVSSGTLVSATSTVYDAQGRPSKQIGADGQVSITEYDARGRTVASLGMHVLAASVGLPNRGSQNAVRLRTETEYNALGQAHKTITNVIEYGTIVSGQFVKSTDPLDVIRTNQRVTEQVFNAKGQVIKTIYPDGTNTQQEFDVLGRVTAEIDQLGNRKDMTYNSAGQLTQIQLPSVPNPLNGNTQTRPTFLYEYNAAGQMTKLTDSNNRVTNFGFNALNQSTSRTLPLGNQETFSYDTRGRQFLQVTFEGIYVRMVYDDSATGGGRLSEKQFFDNAVAYNNGSGTPTERLVYTYDAFGRIVQQQHIRPTVTDPYTTVYDAQGRVTQETTPTGFINYEYDVLGRKTKTLSGTTVPVVLSEITYTYDLLGRLSTVNTVKRDGATLGTAEATTYFYDLLGRPDYTIKPNSVVEDYTFDAMDRLDLMAHKRVSDNSVLASFDYSYRADGKRTGLTESFSSTTARTTSYTWGYDAAGRLTSEVLDSNDNSIDQTETYTYDLFGNRVKKEVNKPATAYVDQVFAYNYDANDRLTNETLDNGVNGAGIDQTTTYGWTQTQQTSKSVQIPSTSTVTQAMSYGLGGQLERVITTTQNGSGTVTARTQVEYRYDPTGIRFIAIDSTDSNLGTPGIERIENGRTEYLIDRANFTGYQQTILETVRNAAGQTNKRTSYTFGVDEITQTVSDMNPSTGVVTSSETLVFGHDGHGSVRVLFGASAAIAQFYIYSAYGEMVARYNAAGSLDASAIKTSILYNGEGFDARTGLYNMRARWYSASNARWERLDPFAGNPTDPFSFNKYGFVHGDPVMGTDPTGKFFSAAGALASIGVQSALRGMHNEVSFNALSAGMAAQAAGMLGDNPYLAFIEALGDGFLDSMISSVPVAGSVYDVFQIAGFVPGLFGTIYDLTGTNSGNATALSGASALSIPAPLLHMLHRGHFQLSKYFAKIRSKAKVDAIARVDGSIIPILGRPQNPTNTIGDPHSAVVLAQALKVGKDLGTEFVAMNVALSTVLRVKGSVGIDSLFKELKGIDFSIPINHRGIAKSLADYRPDAVAIQGNVLTIIEVASPSQMRGTSLLGSYRDQLVAIRDLAQQSLEGQSLRVEFKVFDTIGIEHILK